MKFFLTQHSRLIKGCRANDRAAQEGMYKLFFPEMLRLCYRYMRSDDLAKDALNAAFLKVFQHIGGFDAVKGELGAWIRAIVIRTCIDLGRKEARFHNIHAFPEEEEPAFIEPEALDKLYAEDLLKSIRRLPEASQLVFNLAVFEGYSHKEIAGQLNIGESTSRWHLSEAKKQLRAALAQQEKSVELPTENQERR